MNNKTIKLQIVDALENVQEEGEIVLGEGDTLVCQLPEYYPRSEYHRFHDMMKKALEENRPIAVFPDTVTFKVIKKI